MTPGTSRIARFVAAARNLMLLQVLAALLAIVIAAWAFVEVRELAVERDRLKARVAELEAAQGTAIAPVGPGVPLGPDPLVNQTAPFELPPPVDLAPPLVAPDTNVILPGVPPTTTLPPATALPPTTTTPPATATPPPTNQQPTGEPEAGAPVRRWDCSGANAQNPRCRPLMERPNLPLNSLEPRGPALGPTGNQSR